MTVTAPIEIDQHLLTPINASPTTNVTTIQSSPYTDAEHWLNLTPLTIEYRLTAIALQAFQAVTNNYADADYIDSFNITDIVNLLHTLAKQVDITLPDFTIYVIGFRSCLHKDVRESSEKRDYLSQVDKASHVEANVSGGLLKYWYGVPNDDGKNLATCWWVSSLHAKQGGKGQNHRGGVEVVRSWYKLWQIEQYELTIVNNATDFNFSRI